MIEYRMMDAESLLCCCLHNGKIALEDVKLAPVEAEAGVANGTVAAFLRAACMAYGSCAVLAIEDSNIVAKLRFYPAVLVNMLGEHTCVQTPEHLQKIADLDLKRFPEKDSLPERSLYLHCFQVAGVERAVAEDNPTSYRGRGIGINMLKKLIDWSKAEGWDEIQGRAIQHIPPLMSWSNHLSVERFRKLGFEVKPSDERCPAAVSQRMGYHGEVIKKLWGPYAHISDEEASMMYTVSLDLRKSA